MPMKRLHALFFLLLLIGQLPSVAEEPAKPKVSVKVLSLTEQPTAGGALDLVLLIKNESQEQIRITTTYTIDDYAVSAVYKDGSMVPPTAYPKWYEEHVGGGRRMHTQKIEPQERYLMLIRVSEVIDLSKEDEYTFKISLKNVWTKTEKNIPVVVTAKYKLPQNSFDCSSLEMKKAREMAQQEGLGKVIEPGPIEFHVEPDPEEGEKKK